MKPSEQDQYLPHDYEFLEVCTRDDEHIKSLYTLLLARLHNISHEKMPPYKDHVNFVKNHPYRKWFLIKSKNHAVGSIYLTFNNGIGVNFNEDLSDKDLEKILKHALFKHQPLNEIKSVRTSKFHIRLNPSNKKLIRVASGIGMKLIEQTYSF